MIRLSDRLQMTASMVRPGMKLADIGTDHAYLPVYLIQNSIIPSAYAADLRRGPLDNARSTLEKYGLTSEVSTLLSDGLMGLEPGCCNDFVIAGMGGNLIADILAASPWIREIGNHFVLQPQSHAEDLRKYLLKEGYRIIREDIAAEGKHLYIAMEVVYEGGSQEKPLEYYYLGELLNSNSEYKDDYVAALLKRLNTRKVALMDCCPDSKEILELMTIIDGINKVASKKESVLSGSVRI